MLRQTVLQLSPKTKKIITNLVQIIPNFEYVMHFDGCSKGNPGLSGAGAVIYKDEKEIWCGSCFVGEKATNNQAEYTGLILGLQNALKLNIKSILVKGDSEIVINQLTGKYKCNSPNLKNFHEEAKKLEKNFENIQYYHVLRDLNKRADELSNIAVTNYIYNL